MALDQTEYHFFHRALSNRLIFLIVHSINNYRKSILHSLSLVALLILPKCALCIFAIGNVIAVCGLQPLVTPFWEYLLVSCFLLIHIVIMLYEARNGRKLLPFAVALVGIASVIGFLFFDLSQSFYYVGVLILSISWLLLRIFNARQCKTDCVDTTNTMPFSTIDKT